MTVVAQPIKGASIYSASFTFSFSFRLLAEADLVVLHVDQSDPVVVRTLLLSTDYTVSASPWPTGGTITITAGDQPNFTVGDTVIIHRLSELKQATDYIENDPFPAETHEQTVDISRMIEQELDEKNSRALTSPIDPSIGSKYDALSRGISNVLDPEDDQDAATRGWVGATFVDLPEVLAGPAGPQFLGLVGADVGDGNKTLTVGTDKAVQLWSTILTANRTVTLSTILAYEGAEFLILRTGLGNFTLDIGGLKIVPSSPLGTYTRVKYDGSAWILIAYGENISYDEYDPRYHGAIHDTDKSTSGTDNSAAFESVVSLGAQTIPVKFTGQVGDVTLKNPLNGHNIGVILAKAGSTSVFNLVKDDTAAGWGLWNTLTFENLYLDMLGEDPGGADARTIHGFSYPVTPSNPDKTLAGRNEWHSVTINRADRAIFLPTGNFGNYLYHTVLKNGNYGVFGVESNTPQLMHPGMLRIQDGEISGMRKAAVYLKCPTENINGVRLVNVSIEGNDAHGAYFDGMNLCSDGPVLDQTHFENNDRNGDGTIDLGFGRGVETIRDLMCHDVDHMVIRKTHCPAAGFEFNNTAAYLDAVFFNGSSRLQQDPTSVIRLQNGNFDGISHLADVVIESITRTRAPSAVNGQKSMRAKILPRTHIVTTLPGTGVSVQSITFDEIEPLGALTGVRTAGGGVGGLYKNHNRYAPSASASYTTALIPLVNDKYYVYTTEFMLESDTLAQIRWQNSSNYLAIAFHQIVNDNVVDGVWQALGGCCRYDGTTGNVRFQVATDASAPFFNLGPTQCIQFDFEYEAVAYFNSGAFFDGTILEENGLATTDSGAPFEVTVTMEQAHPNTSYYISALPDKACTFFKSNKTTTSFRLTSSVAAVAFEWGVQRRT